MTMNNSQSRYRSGRKANWRRRQINEVKSRICNPGEAIVLYLPGEMDLDRKVLCEKGFISDNLIAIEANKKTCAILRKKRTLVIEGALSDVLANWPDNWKIGAVIADYQSGIEKEQMYLVWALMHRRIWADSCCISVNLQRGREKHKLAKNFCAGVTQALLETDWEQYGQYAQSIQMMMPHPKSRAYAFFGYLVFHFARIVALVDPSRPLDFDGAYFLLRKLTNPCYPLPYQNPRESRKGVWMDSIIFSWPHDLRRSDPDPTIFDRDIQRSISAIRATRTRRIRGKAPYSPTC